jgi:hypothetical protein
MKGVRDVGGAEGGKWGDSRDGGVKWGAGKYVLKSLWLVS